MKIKDLSISRAVHGNNLVRLHGSKIVRTSKLSRALGIFKCAERRQFLIVGKHSLETVSINLPEGIQNYGPTELAVEL